MSIWAHTLVKNEENFVWFSVMSVIEHVDKILIYDTGSTDRTVEIVKEIKKRYPQKVVFKEVGSVDINEFTKVRQQMLDETKSDWFIVLDGDEIWWDATVASLVNKINKDGDKIETIITPYVNIMGDIYHYQGVSGGKYKFGKRKGFFNLRATNCKIPGLHAKKPHGQQGYYDKNDVLIQNRTAKRRLYVEDISYLHFTNVPRSQSRGKDLDVPKRRIKLKHELGLRFPNDYYYPEVFFKPRPPIVPVPWKRMNVRYKMIASVITPIKLLKRKVSFYEKVGY